MPKKTSKKIPKKNVLEFDINIGGTGLTVKALFAKHVSVMLKSGLTIVEALSIAEDSAQGKFKKILKGVLKSVESGQSLSDSFARDPKVFTGIFISTTQAGEASGTLEGNMEHLAEQLEKEKELVEKIKGAMLYPLVVLVAAFFLGIAMTFLVLPKITPLFEGLGVKLPFTTRALIWFSHFVEQNGTILFISIVFFVIFITWLLKQKFIQPLTHWILLKTPIIKKITKNANLARFCRTLGTLLRSGLNIDEALEITEKTLGNYHFRKALAKINQSIGKGTQLSDNLKLFEKLFPKMVNRMVKVGEESGRLEEVLLYMAEFYELEVDTATKKLATAIEPILLLFIGFIVGFLALSIITPIYNITGNIRR